MPSARIPIEVCGARHVLCRGGLILRYIGLALDFDGTLATNGRVPTRVIDALYRVRSSGRRLIMVTGRELASLTSTFTEVDLFDRIIAENGALLFVPATSKKVALAEPPPSAFAEALRSRGVVPSVGVVIIATLEPHRRDVDEVIDSLGLQLDVILNKGSVMVLPSGVNKGTGVARAADDLGLDPREIVAMGDAENDHSLFRACGLGVAVANAVDALKVQADAVTLAAFGDGVIEVANALVDNDLALLPPRARQEVEVAPSDSAAKDPSKRSR